MAAYRLVAIAGIVAIALSLVNVPDVSFGNDAGRKDAGNRAVSEQSEKRVSVKNRGFKVAQARVCVTPYVVCPLPYLLPYGAPCICYTPYGPVRGIAQ